MGCHSCGEDAEKLIEWQKKCLLLHGWYMHYVYDDQNSPYSVNIHTHGLIENFNHPDLQVCMPLPKKIIHNIVVEIVNRIKERTLFIDKDQNYGDILAGGYRVKFIDAIENGRPVLRMILPDKAGHLEYLDMGPEYQEQYVKLNNSGV